MYLFPQRQLHYRRGLSLAETIVVVSLFTIISFVVFNAIASFYRYNAYTIAQSYQIEHARRGIEFLVRDLREMTFSDDGAFPLVSAGATSVSFYSDIDRDQSVELVEYELTGTVLYKYIYNATGTPLSYDTDSPDETIVISEYVLNSLQGTREFALYDGVGESIATVGPVIDI